MLPIVVALVGDQLEATAAREGATLARRSIAELVVIRLIPPTDRRVQIPIVALLTRRDWCA
jgi:hypothetical protein